MAVAEVGTIPSVVGSGVGRDDDPVDLRRGTARVAADPAGRSRGPHPRVARQQQHRDPSPVGAVGELRKRVLLLAERRWHQRHDPRPLLRRAGCSRGVARAQSRRPAGQGFRALPEFATGNGIEVKWDGRDNGGGMVHDGDYRIDALDQNDIVLAQIVVTVDPIACLTSRRLVRRSSCARAWTRGRSLRPRANLRRRPRCCWSIPSTPSMPAARRACLACIARPTARVL